MQLSQERISNNQPGCFGNKRKVFFKMIDTYTKIVLTVIAVSLATIAVRGTYIKTASAVSDTCGTLSDPCYVKIDGDVPVVNGGLLASPLDVRVTNSPLN